LGKKGEKERKDETLRKLLNYRQREGENGKYFEAPGIRETRERCRLARTRTWEKKKERLGKPNSLLSVLIKKKKEEE